MNNEFYKPYLAELYCAEPQQRYFVYPREELAKEPIFPYLVLDGGAFFFMTERFGAADADTLLEKTLSGELFDMLTDADGNLDWGISYHTTEGTGMPKQHELQSWPQRLYMLLPLAHKYMTTGEKKYADEWLRILRLWVDNSPYEPYRPDTPHINTSMKWRDMQVSWRSMTLLHSIYMLGTPHDEPAFTREEWKYIYDFMDLNLYHLAQESVNAITTNRYGNHVLQIGSVLTSAGVLLCELPRAQQYLAQGRAQVQFCHERAILPDGGSTEASPSYNHFITRLYLEAEMNLELNGCEQIPDLHDSVIRQYQWLAQTARRCGGNLRTSDSYSIDSHADIERMSRIIPFTPDFDKKSVWMRDSGFVMLRNERFELGLDAMKFYGGHQHFGRMQPLLWLGDDELIADTGCVNYDLSDFYPWTMTEDAHNVIFCPDMPDRGPTRDVQVLAFDAEANTVTARTVTAYEGKSYEWTRTLTLRDDGLDVIDSVKASEDMNFKGHWYMGCRPTIVEDGRLARQLLKGNVIELTCDMDIALDRTPALNDRNVYAWLERLTWEHTGREFTVHTKVSVRKK